MANHSHHPAAHDEHHHHHAQPLTNVSRAFIAGIALNFLFVIIECIVGLSIHSLSLLSDAGHNLADVAALALSLLAYRLAKAKPTEQFTYGYSKTTILVALFNAVVLLATVKPPFLLRSSTPSYCWFPSAPSLTKRRIAYSTPSRCPGK
jgi:cobalt-zinc-cadmium efflux system protein